MWLPVELRCRFRHTDSVGCADEPFCPHTVRNRQVEIRCQIQHFRFKSWRKSDGVSASYALDQQVLGKAAGTFFTNWLSLDIGRQSFGTETMQTDGSIYDVRFRLPRRYFCQAIERVLRAVSSDKWQKYMIACSGDFHIGLIGVLNW